MEQILTVNRHYVNGKATRKVTINKSNKSDTLEEAVKYGRLIEKKEVHEGVWVFVGTITTDKLDVIKYTSIGGRDDVDVFKRHGVDVRKMVK